jgi:hypothetical protein
VVCKHNAYYSIVSLTIVHVIKAAMGIRWIIDNQGTTQAIAILVLEMTVVPVRPLQDITMK